MQTRAAVAAFGAEASSKIVTGKVTSDRNMSRPFSHRRISVGGVLRRSTDRVALQACWRAVMFVCSSFVLRGFGAWLARQFELLAKRWSEWQDLNLRPPRPEQVS